MRKYFSSILSLWLLCFAAISPLYADTPHIILQSTTSTENSGLYDYILPKFTEKSGISVRVVAVGTGRAIKNAKNGDADVLIVHSKADELALVQQGFARARYDLMYNDFVLIGPKHNPANIQKGDSISLALQKIRDTNSRFLSRGDLSGTHKREQLLMKKANITPKDHSGKWYLETGSGMGQTLNTAVELQGYSLTDRATWVFFKNKQNHVLLLEGGDGLLNPYGLIQLNNKKIANVKSDLANIFIQWLLSPDGQQAIRSYKVNGKQLFFTYDQ